MSVLAAGIITLTIASWRKTAYTLTTDHLDYGYGLFRRRQRRIQLSQIRTVDIEHPLFGRPLGARALTFSTASGPTRLAYLGPRAASRLHEAVAMRNHAPPGKTNDDEKNVARVRTADLALSIILDAEVMLRVVIGGAVSMGPFLLSGQALTLGFVLPWLRHASRATSKPFHQQHGWTVREVEAGYRTECAFGERAVQQDEVRLGLAQDLQQTRSTVGQQVDDGAGVGVSGGLADSEPRSDLRQGGVLAQVHQCHHRTLRRAELAAAIALTSDYEHRHPLHERMWQVECGRIDDQRGPRATWLRRQAPRSTARGPRSLRFADCRLIGGHLEEAQ